MRISWGQWAAAAAVSIGATPVVLGTGITAAAAVSETAAETAEICSVLLAAEPAGGLRIVSDPPDGSQVAPDSPVAVALAWAAADFDSLDRLVDCVTVDGQLSGSETIDLRPAENTGRYLHRFAIPAGTPTGAQVCVNAMVTGTPAAGGAGGEQRSEPTCFEVGSPVTTAFESTPSKSRTQSRLPPVETTTTTVAVPVSSSTTTTTEAPTTTTTEAPTTTTTTTAPERQMASAPGEVADVELAEAPPLPVPAPVRGRASAGASDRPLTTVAGGAIAVGGLALAGASICRRRRA
jgi:hypothetical protein